MNNIVLKNGIILDGTEEMTPVSGKMIFVKDGIIEKITTDDEKTENYTVIDLENAYIMPGLINLHVHLPASGKPKDKQTDAKKAAKMITSTKLLRAIGTKICASYAETELLSGVTTLRTVGGIVDFDTKVRNKINVGKAIGPRILASNMAISVPGGHMAGSLAYEAETPADMEKYVEIIAKEQPDLIKLMVTGGVLDAKKEGEPGVLRMQPELVKAGCEKAHALGLKTAAHVESPEGVRVALANGVDTIEHGAKPDAEIIALFKERKAALVTTLSPALPYAIFDQSVSHISNMEKVNGNIVFNGIVECAKACLENDIPVGLGTDTGCPYTTHYNMWRELKFFHQYCGVSNAFALYTATLRNARIAGVDQETGSIEVGKSADLIVSAKDPLTDLEALRQLKMVVMKGQIIKNPKVKKMEKVEQELDRVMEN